MDSGQDGEPNKPKHRKWTPEITGMVDRDKYNRTVVGPHDHEPIHVGWRAITGWLASQIFCHNHKSA